ncbi:hypothetical protein UA08_05765 [Talaromyces atroroseus]|uniref:Alpha-1,3-mannosyltransferase CMT1 n=1 Tax=Talaromyces atroroseus TaxID=1441469 RepID=A0A225AVJ3_TALAT|nr:hypothetical protein UA08_05765 [Talaromyces atroroseus]OKL58986.1 hypothetical protein UA08_05765 [Talaromyces atroroseus]
MPFLNTRIRRLLGRLLILAIFGILTDTSWVIYRANNTISAAGQSNSGIELVGGEGEGTQKGGKQRIFISSTHWNNEAILRSHWNTALVQLVKSLGPENVFVSIIESGSWDGTKNALHDLDDALGQMGVKRSISMSETTHSDEIAKVPKDKGKRDGEGEEDEEEEEEEDGWIYTSRGRKELRRIPFLSKQRNDSLKPLVALESKFGMRFDKILFLNDVVFTNDDFYTLLNTNHGSYAAACALDFSKPPYFYDTFALRDVEGHEVMMQTWPYFRASQSRQALEHGEATPVRSCWNSMVIMDSAPFYDTAHPLRFRGIPDSLAKYHLEGSECCIIHADNPLSAEKGVWLNPNVRVGYDGKAYEYVHAPGWPSSSSSTSSKWRIWRWTWESRLRRWFTTDRFKRKAVSRRVKEWQTTTMEGREEKGSFCLVNEMHVLAENGWAHI